jgi:hypothetical protein
MSVKRLRECFKVKEQPAPTLMPVFDGQLCVGHLLNRGKQGWEAFDVDDKSHGIFATQQEAVRTVAEGRR